MRNARSEAMFSAAVDLLAPFAAWVETFGLWIRSPKSGEVGIPCDTGVLCARVRLICSCPQAQPLPHGTFHHFPSC
jgi:hypothetical protein